MPDRKLPYMKFWVGDWLSSQSVMELTPMEEHCYFRLILWSWQAKALGLKSNDTSLAEYCRVPLDVWMECKESVLALFAESEGRLYHHKVEEQMQTQLDISEKRAEAGRKGGRGNKKAIAEANEKQVVKQKLSNDNMAMAMAFNSSSIDIREESKKIRDYYLKTVSPNDQTRTQALSIIDMVLMEETHSPEQLQLAISRYAQEFRSSGSGMATSCRKFFSDRLYVEFLREDWTEPEVIETEEKETATSFLEQQEQKDDEEFQRLMKRKEEEEAL